MSHSKPKVLILSPTYNESQSVESYFRQIEPVIFEAETKYGVSISIKIVDNCSLDSTFTKLCQEARKYPQLSVDILSWVRNYGVMTSVLGGLLESNSDAVFFIDFDLQDPPNLLIQFIENWLSGYSFVYGSRQKRNELLVIRTLRKLFLSVAKRLKVNSTIPVESGVWLMDSSVIDDIKENPPASKYLAGTFGRRGYASTFIPYERNTRSHGESKFSIPKYINYGLEALSSNPFRFARLLVATSLVTLFIGFAAEVFLLLNRYFLDVDIPNGIISLIGMQVISFSLLFLSIGFIGEYVSRIYDAAVRPQVPVAKLFYSQGKSVRPRKKHLK